MCAKYELDSACLGKKFFCLYYRRTLNIHKLVIKTFGLRDLTFYQKLFVIISSFYGESASQIQCIF